MRGFHPWLAMASAVAFLQLAVLTPRRSFPVASGLRFLGVGMVAITGLVLPLELLTQWASGCTRSIAIAHLECQRLGVFPDPLIEEAARISVLVAGVLVVRAYRSARLSDLVFWAVCVNIGAGFVEDTLRYAASGGLLEQQKLALSGLGDLDRSNAWRFPVTLLPGGFHQPQAQGLELLGVGPEFGWFVTGVPAAVGLWLYLQGGRWRVAGIGIVAAGLAWAGFDHAMYNLYLTEHSLFGIVLGGSAAHSSSAWLRVWALLGQGHVLRVILVGALVAAFVLDEQAYCRAHAARFGDRLRVELRRALYALHERRLGLVLEASRLDRRLAALALAPRGDVEEAAAVARRRVLLTVSEPDERPPPAWRRLLDALQRRGVPPRRWLLWAVRVGGLCLALAVLTAIGSGRVDALGWVRVPGLLWLTLAVLGAALALGVAEAVAAARRGDGAPLLFATLGLVGLTLFVVLPAVGQALWGVPPAHFIDQLQVFLEALGQGDLGVALRALTSAVGAGLAVVALGLGAVASWWVGDLAPGLESKRWVVYGLAALALVVGTLLPATAPVLLPLAVGLVRVMAVADLATLAAPAVGNLANGLGYGLLVDSYRLAAKPQAAAEAARRRDAAWTELGTNAPRYATLGAVEYVLGKLGGRAADDLLDRVWRGLDLPTTPTRPRADAEAPPTAAHPARAADLDQGRVRDLLDHIDNTATRDQALDDLADTLGVTPERLRGLAADPALGGAITKKTAAEAVVAVRLEARGELPKPVERAAHPGADFLDGEGVEWDVKAFQSNLPAPHGVFELDTALKKIQWEFVAKENVILDTTGLTPEHLEQLRQAIHARGWGARIRWYP